MSGRGAQGAAVPGGAPETAIVDLVVEDEDWLEALPGLPAIAERAARLALEGAGVAPEGLEIAVLACSDARIAGLNAEFRGRGGPTNVLSWPAFDLAADRPGGPPRPPPGGAVALGDVAIALETTRSEAEAASRPLKDHALHLILHGCLHLLGYDHASEEDAALMEGIERRQMTGIGLPDPYGEGEAGIPRDA